MLRFLFGIVCLFVFVAWLAPARAADPAHADHQPKFKAHVHVVDDKGKEKEEEREYDLSKPEDRAKLDKDLPHIHELKRVEKLDFFGIKRWDTGVWSIVIFLLLFAVMSKFAWGPMIRGLHAREEKIRGALEQAEKTRREAMELQAQLDAKHRAAGAEIAAKMEEARRDAEALKQEKVAEGKTEVQADRDRLLREIGMAKDQALQEIWQQSVTLAALMSSKALRRTMTDADHRRLLDESLAELKQAGAGFAKRSVKGAGL